MPNALTHRSAVLIVAGALLLSGCGLSDYTGQMSSEAVRLHTWDEENRLLGSPAKMPELPKKEDKEQKWNVFLRMPQGVSDAPKTAQGSALAQLSGPLVQYEGSTNNPFGILNVYLGVGSDPKEFATSVFNQFGVSPGGDFVTIPRSPILLSGTGRVLTPEINVKRRAAEGQYAYSFNFYERANVVVAVVYQMDKANSARAEPVIKASLATLGEGIDDAGQMSGVYRKTNRPVRR